MANTKFQTQEGSNQNISFLISKKKHISPETKENKNKRQTQPNTPTPPKIENTKFYHLSLDKSQVKLMPLK
jgi:hypothetical protein